MVNRLGSKSQEKCDKDEKYLFQMIIAFAVFSTLVLRCNVAPTGNSRLIMPLYKRTIKGTEYRSIIQLPLW